MRLAMTLGLGLVLSGCAQGPSEIDPTPPPTRTTPAAPRDEAPTAPPDASPLGTARGYGPRAWRAQRDTEGRIALDVRPARCADFLRELTAHPHPPGSDRNRALGVRVAEMFGDWNLAVTTERFEVLVPTPVRVSVEMASPFAYATRGAEPPLESDFDTRSKEILPPYVAFSPDADIEGELLYANYGRAEDLDALRSRGLSPEGKILLCRLGEIYRGSQVWNAERAGAAGVILYSDPADDGFARGEVHPQGPFRPREGAARGTALYTFIRPGDPGTPGRASRPGAEQLTFDEMETLPRIPVTVLSFADTRPLLEGLGGEVVPDSWRGAGPFTYHLGGDGRCQVRLELTMNYRLCPSDTVVGTLPGTDLASEEILVTCHRDAWTHGAIDPGSGHAVLLEVAQLLAARREADDPMRRTVRFLSFGAEELGLVGSTEWIEAQGEDLARRTVLVVDVDAAVSGSSFEVGGTAAWRDFTLEVGRRAPEGREATMRYGAPNFDADHAAFLGHLGLPALSIGLRGDQGLTHSRYDTFSALRRHIDPEFERHARVADFVARLVSRAANAEILPRDFEAMGEDILARIAATEAARSELDLTPLREPAERLRAAGRRLEEARAALLARGEVDRALAREIDAGGHAAERLLVLETEPGFWRHALHAPDPARGYVGHPLPSLERALARGRGDAQREGARLARRFGALAGAVEGLARRLESVLER